MDSEYRILNQSSFRWEYSVFALNKGLPWLIGFNGFGLSADFFTNTCIVHSLYTHFNLLFIDLPYYKDHFSKNEKDLKAPDIGAAIKAIIEKENIVHYSFLAYSMGNRMLINALKCQETLQPNYFFMLAPDGFARRIWVKNILKQKQLKNFAKSSILKPQSIYRLINSAAGLGIIKKSTQKFLLQQINSPLKRQRIFNTYWGIRHLRYTFMDLNPPLNAIIIYGDKDFVISLKELKRGVAKANIKPEWRPIKSSHFLLSRSAFTQVCQIIREKYKINIHENP